MSTETIAGKDARLAAAPGAVTLTARTLEARDGGRALSPGELTRIAVILATTTRDQDADLTRCRVCGAPLQRPALGRPRIYCSPRCRRAAERAKAGRNR